MEEKQFDKEVEITLQNLVQFHDKLQELYENNINLRMKYPTQPMKFYQSEEEIDNILQHLQEATQQHIPIIVESKILVPILKILNHPNSDINMSCIQFLHEIISEEPTDDQVYEIYYRLCIWMIENGLFESLAETIGKMREEENVQEYEISLKILKIIETLTELWDQSVETLAVDTKILEYLANRIMPNYVVKHKTIDDNKFVSSDILALILSNSQQGQLRFHHLFGMQILIESIRPYLSKDAVSNDEQEYVSNLFDCINIMLINTTKQFNQTRKVYHEMKGNQIMLQFVKAKNIYSIQALKAIASSFTELPEQIERHEIQILIEYGGLKYLFPIILRQGLKGKDVDEQKSIDENCLQIINLLVRSTSQMYRIRVQSKFSEKRFVKLEKLLEIRAQYLQNIGKETQEQLTPEDYFQRLKQGLRVVEVIDKIFCNLISSTSTVREKLVVLMKLYGVTGHDIETTLRNSYKFIGENSEKHHLERLLSDNVHAIYQVLQKNSKEQEKQEKE